MRSPTTPFWTHMDPTATWWKGSLCCSPINPQTFWPPVGFQKESLGFLWVSFRCPVSFPFAALFGLVSRSPRCPKHRVLKAGTTPRRFPENIGFRIHQFPSLDSICIGILAFTPPNGSPKKDLVMCLPVRSSGPFCHLPLPYLL